MIETNYIKKISGVTGSPDTNTTESIERVDYIEFNHEYDFKYNKFLTIATHNVQEFNNISKQREFFDEYNGNNIDIIGITETKLSQKNGKNILKYNKNFKSWWTGLEDTSYTGSVGIAIRLGLHLHVANVITKKGRLISIDLNFKGTEQLRIINIYINASETENKLRDELITDLTTLIQEAKGNSIK